MRIHGLVHRLHGRISWWPWPRPCPSRTRDGPPRARALVDVALGRASQGRGHRPQGMARRWPKARAMRVDGQGPFMIRGGPRHRRPRVLRCKAPRMVPKAARLVCKGPGLGHGSVGPSASRPRANPSSGWAVGLAAPRKPVLAVGRRPRGPAQTRPRGGPSTLRPRANPSSRWAVDLAAPPDGGDGLVLGPDFRHRGPVRSKSSSTYFLQPDAFTPRYPHMLDVLATRRTTSMPTSLCLHATFVRDTPGRRMRAPLRNRPAQR
jgi:hypothetical protein